MKTKIYLILTVVVMIGCSCNPTSSKIDYLPCIMDENEDWGFVNAKGEVFCRNTFEHEPTEVRESVFFVWENGSYSMYQFDKENPKLLLDGIGDFGKVAEGLVPICKKDSCIEIVDTKGSTRFVLDKIDEQEIISCDPEFKYGYLSISTANDYDDESLCGIVDKFGTVVIYPKYKWIHVLGDNLFYVNYEEDGLEQQFFIDKEENKLTQWENDLSVDVHIEEYITAFHNGHLRVYNKKGEEVFKCPSKVQEIHQFEKDIFVFSKEDYDDWGVMNLKGEVILTAKFRNITMVNNGFIAENKNGDVQLYDSRGEFIAEISDDFDDLEYVDGFGILQRDGNSYYILDDDFKPINKIKYEEITGPYVPDGDSEYVVSDYFNPNTVVYVVTKALVDDLNDIRIGMPPTSITNIKSMGTSEFSSYSRSVRFGLTEGLKYSVYVTFRFDKNIITPVYVEKQVEHEDSFWGTYHTTETVFSHYAFNEEALLTHIEIECNVPDSKKEFIKKELASIMEEYAKYGFTLSVNEDDFF